MKTLAAAAALGTVLTVSALPGTPSYAAAETCHGQTATIVGDPGTDVTGTEGPDVIVARGAGQALGGDDMICLLGSYGEALRCGQRV